MAYKPIQQENVFIDGGKKLATLFTLTQGPPASVGRTRIRYVVRAGKKGTGRILAQASCTFGYRSQKAAQDEIRKKLNGVEFLDETNIKKFERAGYIPDPYER